MKSLLLFLSPLALLSASLSLLGAAERRVVTELPPGFAPCKIVKQERAIFPPRLLQDGVARGEAHVVVEVGVDGKVTDALITLYTHRGFADEGLRVVQASRYAAAMADGHPLISIVELQFVFDSPELITTSHIGLTNLTPSTPTQRYAYYPVSLANLDQRPTARKTTAPIYPQAWIDQGRKGTITVSFYIDESGRVRMPIARDAHDDLLATAACEAMKEWRFDPPLHHGQPVLAQAELPIIFDPPPKGAAPNR